VPFEQGASGVCTIYENRALLRTNIYGINLSNTVAVQITLVLILNATKISFKNFMGSVSQNFLTLFSKNIKMV